MIVSAKPNSQKNKMADFSLPDAQQTCTQALQLLSKNVCLPSPFLSKNLSEDNWTFFDKKQYLAGEEEENWFFKWASKLVPYMYKCLQKLIDDIIHELRSAPFGATGLTC